MAKPKLERAADDPWLTQRMQEASTVARGELAMVDAVDAAYAAALAEVWRDAMDQPGSLTAASVPDPEAAIEAAREAWTQALGEFLQPILTATLGDRWQGVYDAVMEQVPDAELASYAHLATVPNRLVERYWDDQLERIGRSIDAVFDDMRVDISDALSRGESVDQVRDRVARILQIDAGSRELRDKIDSVERRMRNPHLSDSKRDQLLARRSETLHELFLVRGRRNTARARLRLAEALAQHAERLPEGDERDEFLRRAREARDEAERLNPSDSDIEAVNDQLSRIDRELYENPDLTTDERDALKSRRATLYDQLRDDENGWHYRARRIARTETIGTLNSGTVEAAETLAEATEIELNKRWLATSDYRTRPSHVAADEQVVPISEPFTVGGYPLKFPGDPSGPAGETIQCRCTVLIEEPDGEDVRDSIAASGGTMQVTEPIPDESTADMQPLVSEAAANAPYEPPNEWFGDPALPMPSPITVTREGRVMGHVAAWRECHAGFEDTCVQAPRSASGYEYFHYGTVIAASGDPLRVGKLTVGGGHADANATLHAAAEHYDDVATSVAVVRAGEDQHGIWVAGSIRPSASPDQVYDLITSPLSGDWRMPRDGTSLEMVAAHAVNVPGFGIRASAVVGEQGQLSLTSAGILTPRPELSLDPDVLDRQRRVAALTAAVGRDPASRIRAAEAAIGMDPGSRADRLAASIGLD